MLPGQKNHFSLDSVIQKKRSFFLQITNLVRDSPTSKYFSRKATGHEWKRDLETKTEFLMPYHNISIMYRSTLPLKSAHMSLKIHCKLLRSGMCINIIGQHFLNDIRWNMYEIKNLELCSSNCKNFSLLLHNLEKLIMHQLNKRGASTVSDTKWAHEHLDIPHSKSAHITHQMHTLNSGILEILDTRLVYVAWINEMRKRFMLIFLAGITATQMFASIFSFDVNAIISSIHFF